MTTQAKSSLWSRPASRPGWWAVGLMTAFIVMFIINQTVFMNLRDAGSWQPTLLPFYGIAMLLCGLCGGIAGLVALLKARDHSWLVWLTLLPMGMVLFFVLGEFLGPAH